MLDLAGHIIETMIGHFQPKKFEDRYEDALRDLIKRKQAGEEIMPAKAEKPEKKMNLMDALRASLQGANRTSNPSARKRVAGKTRRVPARGARSGHAGGEGRVEPLRLVDRANGPRQYAVKGVRSLDVQYPECFHRVIPERRPLLPPELIAPALSESFKIHWRRAIPKGVRR
jgi:hypothetical protein